MGVLMELYTFKAAKHMDCSSRKPRCVMNSINRKNLISPGSLITVLN